MIKGSNESKDSILLVPMQHDIVAVKAMGDNYKLGLIISIDMLFRVRVGLLYYGQYDEPLVHVQNLGLVF